MVIAALATRPRKPNNLSRQVARLAASHQISKSRQANSGPKTATIQYFAAPSSEMPGPNRAASIRRASRNAGQALSGRNCFRESSGALGRSGAFSCVFKSFMRPSPVDCSWAKAFPILFFGPVRRMNRGVRDRFSADFLPHFPAKPVCSSGLLWSIRPLFIVVTGIAPGRLWPVPKALPHFLTHFFLLLGCQ